MWNRLLTGIKIFGLTLLGFIYIIHYYHPQLYYVQDSYTVNELKHQIVFGHDIEHENVEQHHVYTESLAPVGTSKAILSKAVGNGYVDDSFCDNFFHKTSENFLPVCNASNDPLWNSIIACYKPVNSHRTIECAVNNILIYPKRLLLAVNRRFAPHPTAAKLLVNGSVKCDTLQRFKWHLPRTKFVAPLITEAVQSLAHYTPHICDRWINHTVILFKGCNNHVYFNVLLWYAVFKAITDRNLQETFQVMRCKGENYTYYPAFVEFEKRLFPNIVVTEDLQEESICFKKLVILPEHFDSLLYRCKMESNIMEQCYQCSSKDRSGTTIALYRSFVLRKCSVDDSVQVNGYRFPQKIVYLRRKQYLRRPNDSPQKFHRVISNADEMLAELSKSFKVNVTYFYGEDHSLCEQVRLVHDADILIGVHGAGLVHAWWLQKNALLFEIVPEEKADNLAFKMISTLAGVNYKGYYLKQKGYSQIKLNINDLINNLSDIIQNGV